MNYYISKSILLSEIALKLSLGGSIGFLLISAVLYSVLSNPSHYISTALSGASGWEFYLSFFSTIIAAFVLFMCLLAVLFPVYIPFFKSNWEMYITNNEVLEIKTPISRIWKEVAIDLKCIKCIQSKQYEADIGLDTYWYLVKKNGEEFKLDDSYPFDYQKLQENIVSLMPRIIYVSTDILNP